MSLQKESGRHKRWREHSAKEPQSLTNWYVLIISTRVKQLFLTCIQTNCLTVTMFDDAIQQAKELDDHFKRTGKTVGPLHGLPISLKDNFNIRGKTSATGFCAWADEPMKKDSTIVQILRELGAVAYVKTNVPTAMMIAESVNNCYGR
jgi:Asp-tRNA(Asn)/Glu-tRNA(Gln) amidotransferase A subunit family amidase